MKKANLSKILYTSISALTFLYSMSHQTFATETEKENEIEIYKKSNLFKIQIPNEKIIKLTPITEEEILAQTQNEIDNQISFEDITETEDEEPGSPMEIAIKLANELDEEYFQLFINDELEEKLNKKRKEFFDTGDSYERINLIKTKKNSIYNIIKNTNLSKNIILDLAYVKDIENEEYVKNLIKNVEITNDQEIIFNVEDILLEVEKKEIFKEALKIGKLFRHVDDLKNTKNVNAINGFLLSFEVFNQIIENKLDKASDKEIADLLYQYSQTIFHLYNPDIKNHVFTEDAKIHFKDMLSNESVNDLKCIQFALLALSNAYYPTKSVMGTIYSEYNGLIKENKIQYNKKIHKDLYDKLILLNNENKTKKEIELLNLNSKLMPFNKKLTESQNKLNELVIKTKNTLDQGVNLLVNFTAFKEIDKSKEIKGKIVKAINEKDITISKNKARYLIAEISKLYGYKCEYDLINCKYKVTEDTSLLKNKSVKETISSSEKLDTNSFITQINDIYKEIETNENFKKIVFFEVCGLKFLKDQTMKDINFFKNSINEINEKIKNL